MGNKSKHHSDQRVGQNDVLVARKDWLFYLGVAVMLSAYAVFMGHWAIR